MYHGTTGLLHREHQKPSIRQAYLALVNALAEGEQVTIALSVVEGVEFDKDRVQH